ncbi:oligosaccharide flippase family protein [Candidatus Micrarchaeota archaeon]|nr:oligosaccharide flippase family protein [Candidatus Micrarchaeota archaeon]
MSLLSKTLKSTAVMSISNYMTLVVSIAAFLFLVWALTPEQYGTYILVLSFVYFAAQFSDLGTSKVIITDLAKHIEGRNFGFVKRFLKTHLLVQFGLGGIFLLSFICLPDLFLGEETNLESIIAIGGLMVLTETMLRAERQIFLSQAKFRNLAILNGGASILRLAVLLVLVHYADMGIEGAIFSFVIANSAIFLLFLPSSLSFIKGIWKSEEVKKDVYLETMWGRGKYLIVATQIKNVSDKAPLWFISYFFGTVDVAVFSVARRMLEPITKFVSSLETVALPLLSQLWVKNKEKAVQMYTSFAKLGFYSSLGLAAIAFFIVPIAIEYLFPGEYGSSIPIFQVLLATTVLLGFGSAQRAFLNVLDLQKVFVYSYSLGLIILSISFLISAPVLGILSAPVSIVLKGAASLGYREWKIYKHEIMKGTKIQDLFIPTKKDWVLFNRIKKSMLDKLSNGANFADKPRV